MQAQQPLQSSQTKKRDDYFDNARFVLIFLVVFGHFISPVKHESGWLYALYNFIYTFHMPAFILIAGFYTKKAGEPGYLVKLLKKVLVPYLVFQVLYTVFYFSLYSKSDLDLTLFDPQWSLWFLLSLLFWNVLLTIFIQFRYPLLIAILLGIAVGYFQDAGTYLSISRTFVFFPFFVLGHYMKKEHFKHLFTPATAIAAGLLLSALFVTYAFYIPDKAKDWLLAASPYSQMLESGFWFGGLIRVGFYILTSIATFSFLAVIPRGQWFFTRLGAHTLYIYLLHGFILKYILTTPMFDSIIETQQYVLLAVLAAAVCFVLSSRPVTAIMEPLIELRWTKLKKLIHPHEQKERRLS